MSIRAECGACGAKYELEERFAGQKLRCLECDKVFTVPSPADDRAGDPENVDPLDLLDLAERIAPKKVAEEGPPPIGVYKPPVPQGRRKKVIVPTRLATAAPEYKPITAHDDVPAPEPEVPEAAYGKKPRRERSAESVKFMESYLPLAICLVGYLPIVISMFSRVANAAGPTVRGSSIPVWPLLVLTLAAIVLYLVLVIPLGSLGLGLSAMFMRFAPPTPLYFVVLSLAAGPAAVVLLGRYFAEETGSPGFFIGAIILAIPLTFTLFCFYNRQGFAIDLAAFVLTGIGLALGTVIGFYLLYLLNGLLAMRWAASQYFG